MKIKIKLKYKAGHIKEIEVDQSKILDSSILQHDEHFFIYSTMNGNSFGIATFIEVAPPVKI